MGRQRSTHRNLPPHLRKRVRREYVYCYFDISTVPRKEIALGTDFIQVLRN